MSQESADLFQVPTFLGFSLRTTRDYWLLIESKHPKLSGWAEDVAQVLSSPDRICNSQHDSTVDLLYHPGQQRLPCGIVKRVNGEEFLITAYPCDKIKEEEMIWPK